MIIFAPIRGSRSRWLLTRHWPVMYQRDNTKRLHHRARKISGIKILVGQCACELRCLL